MATEATGREKVPVTNDITGGLAALLQQLGGTKTTSSPGDTAALQNVMSQLQGQDYEKMLQAIFNKAGGQIPGLQAAMSNAIGARTGGNSAVAAALQKLMQDTTVNAQDQIAKLQSQNMQTQMSAAANVAQATKGTTQKTGTDVGGGLANAAKILALLQGGKQLGLDKAFGFTDSKQGPGTDMTGFQSPMQPVNYSAPDVMSPQAAFNNSIFTDFATSNPFTSDIANNVAGNWSPTPSFGGSSQVAGDAYMPAFEPQPSFTPVAGDAYMPAYEPSFTPSFDSFEQDWYNATNYADGGIVKKPEGYADGGTIRAGGSRRSANPEIAIAAPQKTQVSPIAAPVFQAPASGSLPSSGQMTSAVRGGGNLNYTSNSGGDFGGSFGVSGAPSAAGSFDGKAAANALGKMTTVNNMLGMTTGVGIPGLGKVTGPLAGFMAAEGPEAKAKSLGLSAINAAVPGSVAAIQTAMNPNIANVTNLAASFNPVTALTNMGLGLAGTSLGQLGANTVQNYGLGTTVNPDAGIVGALQTGYRINNSPDPLGAFIGAMDNWGGDTATNTSGISGGSFGGGGGGTSSTGGGGFGNSTASGSSFGGGGYSGGGFGSGSYGGGAWADGGAIDGPGTGVSDSIPARLSDGEFVISADVVETLGEDFFNQLQAAFHTPAAQQKRMG